MGGKDLGLHGLSGLVGDMSKLGQVATENRVIELDPSEIVVEVQVREVFNEIEELSQNIAEIGQQTPVTIGPKNNDTGKYPLRFGERRLRAVSLIPGKKVKCIIDATERDEATLIKAQVSENEQRSGLLPHEVARSIHRYMAARLAQGFKLTYPKVALEWNKSEHYISVHARLTDLPKCIIDLIVQKVTLDYELLYSLKQFHDQAPAECEKFIEESKLAPEGLTRAAARQKSKEAKIIANGGSLPPPPPQPVKVQPAAPEAGSEGSGANSSQAPSVSLPASNDSGEAEPAGGAAPGSLSGQQKTDPAKPGQPELTKSKPPAAAVGANEAFVAIDGTPRAHQLVGDLKAMGPLAKAAVRDYSKVVVKEPGQKRAFMWVSVSTDSKVLEGELLTNCVVEGHADKCVVQIQGPSGSFYDMVVDFEDVQIQYFGLHSES